jgi:hypothetical protein
MNVFVQLSSNLGSDLGPNFSVTANVGSVQPNTATKTELTSGRYFEVDESASFLTIADQGGCGTQLQIEIGGKTPETCFTETAENWLPGNARKFDENGSPAPFRSQSITQQLFEEITTAEFGQEINLTFFGNNYIFSINEEAADEESGTLYRNGITFTGIEPESTLVVVIQDFGFGEARATIFDYKKRTVYEIYEKDSSYIVDEWSTFDYF